MTKLITDEYADVLAWEHANTPGQWGHTAEMYTDTILRHSEGITDWLDYGAGSGGLARAMSKRHPKSGVSITEYEPSRPGALPPEPKPYVVCIDVLEHVEPELIDNVLADLVRVTENTGYFTISCRLATKILKDGRNAHILVKPPEWWEAKLKPLFELIETSYAPGDKNYRVKVKRRK
jgi:hypothetical protein